ncbi:endonuclease III domain-containing protein [Candidatus Latescibacterota bacterium]
MIENAVTTFHFGTSLHKESRRLLLMKLYNAMEKKLGPTNWWPADTPFEVCVGAILTQNAPWAGVEKSIANLKNLSIFNVDSIAETPVEVIADAVRPSIYYNQKAKRLKLFCKFLRKDFKGKIENMTDLKCADARERLLSLPGIGRETADSMLLYALKIPVFVVDAYTRRIFSRHGLIDPTWDYETLRHFFEEVLESNAVFYGEFHALICLLGSGICRGKPKCDDCPVLEIAGKPIY